MSGTNIIDTVLVIGELGRPTIWFLKGLPASGKSSWAMANCNKTCMRLNNDIFRSMLGVAEYNRDMETTVGAGIRAAGMHALSLGFDIIVDNTNLGAKHKNFWMAYAEQHGNRMIEKFFDTPLDECIQRDSTRMTGLKVGAERITEMYYTHLAPFTKTSVVEYAEQNPDLKHAIIVDIDGTMAFMNDRGPYDDSKVHTDLPNDPVILLVMNMFLNDIVEEVIIVSGRQATETCKAATEEWLDAYLGIPYTLFMREAGDTRKDSVVKKEIFDSRIKDKYYIQFVLDDRNQVVDMWRKELNLPCFQVNYGDF
jgi:predicted kinase